MGGKTLRARLIVSPASRTRVPSGVVLETYFLSFLSLVSSKLTSRFEDRCPEGFLVFCSSE